MRFECSLEEYKKYKLGELVENVVAGATPKTSVDDYWNGGDILWLSSGEVHKKFIYFTDKFITSEGYNNSSTKIVPTNSVLIALAGQGKTRGTVAINKIELCTNQSIASIIPNEMLNYKYLFYYLESKYEYRRALSSSDGGRGGLNLKLIRSIPIQVPSIKEQENISNFINEIDKKILLLEQKHKLYDDFKKYLMQQIFTQKLRFADSDSCWKEISLKDIGTFYRGHSYNSTNVADEGLLVLRSNNIQGNVLDFSEDGLQFVDKDCKKELELQKNDIVICMSNGTRRLVGKSAEYTGNYENKVTVGAFCSIFRTKNKLAKYLFQTESYKKNLYLILAGTNINNLKNSDLEKFKFNIPTNESEINKIHDLFVSIDNKIDYNKKQLEEITLFKKGLLQQMFVVRINWRCNFKLAKSPSFNKHLLILKNKIIFIIIK